MRELDDDLWQFYRSLPSVGSGPDGECHCGRRFWDSHNLEHYDRSDEEVARLRADLGITPVDAAIGHVVIDGTVYCDACDCWHEKARRIIAWVRDNSEFLREWFKRERCRLRHALSLLPSADDLKQGQGDD